MGCPPRRAMLVTCLSMWAVSTAAADTIIDLLPPNAGWYDYAQATAINDNGWVVGYTGGYQMDFVPVLWIPNGGTSIIGIRKDVQWEIASAMALDIHDNGDILVQFYGIDGPWGDCVSHPCTLGGYHAVVHAGGGPLLSPSDYYIGENEWLPDQSRPNPWVGHVDLWGPVAPRQTNASGQYFQNLGGDPRTGICTWDYPCQVQLITPSGEIPEPSSVVLLATAAGAIAFTLRRRFARR